MVSIFQTISKIIYGYGAVSTLGAEVKRLGGNRVLIITDKGLAKNNVHQPVIDALNEANIPNIIFSEVQLDPTPAAVEKCVEVIKEFKADLLVGIGGGSALDSTKGASLLATHGGPLDKYYGMHLVPSACIPTILIPTTAGAGSEMTSICVLTDSFTNSKKGIVSEYLYTKMILLDPELTLTLPPNYTAYTGLDAFVHAMESYVSKNATPFTEGSALQAMQMIAENICEAYSNGSNKEARAQMLYASSIAGMAFSNTQNGVIHAIGMAVPATHHIPHGLLMAAITPMGIKFNSRSAPEKYAKIADILGCKCGNKDIYEHAASAADAFKILMKKLGVKPGLAAYGVKPEEIRGIAELAASTRRLMDSNPRDASPDELEDLIKENF